MWISSSNLVLAINAKSFIDEVSPISAGNGEEKLTFRMKTVQKCAVWYRESSSVPGVQNLYICETYHKLFLCRCRWNVYLHNVLPEFMLLPLFFSINDNLSHFLQAAQDVGFANFIVAMKTFWYRSKGRSVIYMSVLHYMVTKFFLQTFFILLKGGLAMVAEESTFLRKIACCT